MLVSIRWTQFGLVCVGRFSACISANTLAMTGEGENLTNQMGIFTRIEGNLWRGGFSVHFGLAGLILIFVPRV